MVLPSEPELVLSAPRLCLRSCCCFCPLSLSWRIPVGAYRSLGSCRLLEEDKSRDGKSLKPPLASFSQRASTRTGDVTALKPVSAAEPLLQAALFPSRLWWDRENIISRVRVNQQSSLRLWAWEESYLLLSPQQLIMCYQSAQHSLCIYLFTYFYQKGLEFFYLVD